MMSGLNEQLHLKEKTKNFKIGTPWQCLFKLVDFFKRKKIGFEKFPFRAHFCLLFNKYANIYIQSMFFSNLQKL